MTPTLPKEIADELQQKGFAFEEFMTYRNRKGKPDTFYGFAKRGNNSYGVSGCYVTGMWVVQIMQPIDTLQIIEKVKRKWQRQPKPSKSRSQQTPNAARTTATRRNWKPIASIVLSAYTGGYNGAK